MAGGPLELALRIADRLDELGIPYVLGGSLASSVVGEPRATADVDFAIRIRGEDLPRLIASLGSEFYVSEEAARSAVERHSSFNLVHLETVQKVDLFVLGEDLLDRRQLQRRRRVAVSDSPRRELWVGSPEDQILRKLLWYRAGSGVSDRQWRDVLGILAVQQGRIDCRDLEEAAEALGLRDLLNRAMEDAGLPRTE